jgi:hypothetical protein
MNETLLLYTAVFVFALMVVGLVLTVIEFSRGEPNRQALQAQRNSHGETVGNRNLAEK